MAHVVLKRSLFGAFLILGSTTFLGGCDQTKKMMGLKRQTPDEFGVLDRAPLSTPPGLGLKPPAPGATRAQETNPQDKAKDILIKSDEVQPASTSQQKNLSSSEAYLLDSTGVDQRDEEIRKIVDHEAKVAKPKERFVEKILFWQKKEDKADVIDANEEHQRLHGEEHPTEQLK